MRRVSIDSKTINSDMRAIEEAKRNLGLLRVMLEDELQSRGHSYPVAATLTTIIHQLDRMKQVIDQNEQAFMQEAGQHFDLELTPEDED